MKNKNRIDMKNKLLYQITRKAARAMAALIAAAGMAGACSDEGAVPVPDEEFYDGPLQIRAKIRGTLETRTTHEPGELRDDGETWYLSCPLRDYVNKESNNRPLGVLQAKFGSEGYAILTDADGKVVDIRWNDLLPGPVVPDKYVFVLDNVPRMKGAYLDTYVDHIIDDVSDKRYAQGVVFTEEEKKQYRASLENEDGRINSILSSCARKNERFF